MSALATANQIPSTAGKPSVPARPSQTSRPTSVSPVYLGAWKTTMTELETVINCTYLDEPHEHVYPGDWIFGGACGTHPGADPRYRPTTYTYRNEMLEHIYVTQAPLCEEQALDEFTNVSQNFPGSNPVYLEIVLPGGVPKLSRWRYNSSEDTLSPIPERSERAAQKS